MSFRILQLLLLLIFINAGQYLQAQSCDCNDYLYLNDTGLNYVEKFKVENGTGNLTEIGDAQNGNPWLDADGVVDYPHGIGADINGSLYIGETDGVNNEFNIQKFNCAGEKIDANISTPAIDNFTDDGFGYSHFIRGEYLYVNIQTTNNSPTSEVRIYETCSGNNVGCQTLAGVSSLRLWGFAEGTDGYWYGTRGTRIVRGPLDPATFGAAGSCNEVIEEVASVASLGIPTFTNGFIQGIDQDADGILYCVYSSGFGFQPPSYVFSYNMTTGALAYSATDSNIETNVADNLNWAGARGLVWSPLTDRLYVSSAEDCIAAFDTDLNYLPANSNHVTGAYPKQIGLVTECCPTTDLTFNESVCGNASGERIFLQDLFSCGEGIVCEGVWSELSNTSGGNIVLNDCDLSITVNGTGCATYGLLSDGTANLNQCGSFSITVNVCAELPAAMIATNPGTCTGATPNNDATIVLSNVTGDEAGIIAGADYTGGPAYGSGNLDVSSDSGTFMNLMHSTQYTVRVFSGANDCYEDYTITTPTITCTVACNLTDAGETSVSCNDNSTNTDPSDDYITLSLNPIGTGLGATYSVTADNGGTVSLTGGGAATGISYGSATAFRLQNGSADGATNYTITVTDDTDGTCTITTTVMQDNCALQVYSLGNRVFYDDDINGVQNGTEAGVDGVTLQLLNTDGTIYDSDEATPGVQGLTVTTANGGYYRFDGLPAGNYIVEVLPAMFGSGGILETYSSSDGAGQEASPNNDGDLNDNGLDTTVGGAIRSGVITLGGTEPTGEDEPGTYGASSTTGTASADEFSNLTVDFGFYRQRDTPNPEDPQEMPCPDEPCHFISTEIYFGNGVSNDGSGVGGTTPDTNTEDGLLLGNNINASPGGSLNLPISIFNNTGSDAYFRMWIDWNGDGDFDEANEQVADELFLSAVYAGTFTVHQQVSIPLDANSGQGLALRMRVSTDDANTLDPCGNGSCAADGEIEDYRIEVNCPVTICLPVQLIINR